MLPKGFREGCTPSFDHGENTHHRQTVKCHLPMSNATVCKLKWYNLRAGLSCKWKSGRLYAISASPMLPTNANVINSGCQLKMPEVSLTDPVSTSILGDSRKPPKEITHETIPSMIITCNALGIKKRNPGGGDSEGTIFVLLIRIGWAKICFLILW